MIARAQTALLVLVLLGAGVLLGSFLLEWQGHRLRTPDPGAPLEGLPAAVPPGDEVRISVEVLNGAGEPGAAARVTEALRDAGFDVKTFGNADTFAYDSTLVLDRSGRRGAAGEVAAALGVARVRSDPDPEIYLDATVVLGRDWRDRLADLR